MKRENNSLSPKGTEELCRKWLLQTAQGDAEALVRLYEALFRPLCFFVLSILEGSADAEDIVQETFIRVYRSAEQYQGTASAKTWIFAIAKNLCRNHLRSQNRQPAEEPTVSDPGDLTAIEAIEALRCLEREERQLMVLQVFGGFRIKEIATLLEISEKQAYYRKKTAVKKLKAYYTERDRSEDE